MNVPALFARIRAYCSRLTPVQWAKILFGIFLIVLGSFWHVFISPPKAFPTNSFVFVESDMPLSAVASRLEDEQVIRSALMYHVWGRITGGDRNITAGRYLFEKPLSIFEVAGRIQAGDTGVESIRVTFPEGLAVFEMAELLRQKLPDFDGNAFYTLAKPHEGYLFPDTYFIEPGTSPEDIVSRLRRTFDERTVELFAGRDDRADVVILASLLEKEADTPEDRRLVAGVLQNRLEDNMPLQVDATFGYTKEVSGYVPTGDDPDVDSPYNTYLNRGLPPTAIANPGLDALIAAAHPPETEYYYYLTGRDGKMYYARTFEGHKENRERYLD